LKIFVPSGYPAQPPKISTKDINAFIEGNNINGEEITIPWLEKTKCK
jgi:ubiquitin-protein ligase